MAPIIDLCFRVKLEILHLGEEVLSKSGGVFLLGFGGCIESTVGNDSREDLGRRSHVGHVGWCTHDGEAGG